MWICELPQNLLNELRLRKLGIFRKITEMLSNDGNYAAGHPKGKFWKSKMYFLKNEKLFVTIWLRIRLLILMRSTIERNNLMRLCGWRLPYTWPPIYEVKYSRKLMEGLIADLAQLNNAIVKFLFSEQQRLLYAQFCNFLEILLFSKETRALCLLPLF